jgi:hypothetical protein
MVIVSATLTSRACAALITFVIVDEFHQVHPVVGASVPSDPAPTEK